MNYKNGKIYSIRNYETDKYYIGSTCQTLTKRLSKHKSNYRDWQKNGKRYMTSFEILKCNDCYIELLEEFPCENKNQLHKREGELIRENKLNCVNIVIPLRTDKEYRIDNKEKRKENWKKYYEKNKDSLVQKRKVYNENNKEKVKGRGQKYREANKEQIQDYMKVYRAKVTDCDCGQRYTHSHKSRHINSIKHKSYFSKANMIKRGVQIIKDLDKYFASK